MSSKHQPYLKISDTEEKIVSERDKQSKTCGTISQTTEEGSLKQVRESGLIHNETSRENDVLIDRVHAVTIRAPVTIEGIKMNAVVDTGAEVTVMHEKRFQEIPAKRRPQLQQAKKSLVVAEAGRKMRTSGTAEVEMTMGDEEYVLDMYVAPFAYELSLVCDFLDEHDVTINTWRGL